jgi:enoyl-CoA hydratase
MEVEVEDGVALLAMRAPKANAIGEAWLARMDGLLAHLEANAPAAMVMTGEGRAFSAGLNLPEIIELDRRGLQRFILAFSRTMLRVSSLPWPVVAAVNGHAIAGGCVLAMQADERIMAEGEGRIGLNEVQLGIGIPAVILETLRWQVPPSTLLPVAMEGELVDPHRARALGLVHEVVPPGQLLPRARARARQLASVPGAAFQQIKHALHRPAREAAERRAEEDAAEWVETFFSPQGQERLRAAVARLRRG